MRSQDVVSRLAAEFGKDRILVHSQYHIQVTTPDGPHNVWLTSTGSLKYQLCGQRTSIEAGIDRILSQIRNWNFDKTEVYGMRQALDLSAFIRKVELAAKMLKARQAIFVDAGWKGGKARIGIVIIDGDRVMAESFPMECSSHNDAELVALREGLSRCREGFLVYSDSRNSVDAVQDERARWIPRSQNRAADRISSKKD